MNASTVSVIRPAPSATEPVPDAEIIAGALELPVLISLPENTKSPVFAAPPEIVVQSNTPLPSVVNDCPALPSAVGYSNPDMDTLPVPLAVIFKLSLERVAAISLSTMLMPSVEIVPFCSVIPPIRLFIPASSA